VAKQPAQNCGAYCVQVLEDIPILSATECSLKNVVLSFMAIFAGDHPKEGVTVWHSPVDIQAVWRDYTLRI